MSNRRKSWRPILLLAWICASLPLRLAAAELTLAENLRRDGQQAESACVPLLLEFAASDCEYCTLLEEEVLRPMLLNRDYDRRVLMRKLLLDSSRPLRDFDGDRTDAARLADRYRVFVTPTLLFLDSRGNELAERMVGVTTLDFYGGYLDQALDVARERLRESGRCH